jgi:hypothetical protein
MFVPSGSRMTVIGTACPVAKEASRNILKAAVDDHRLQLGRGRLVGGPTVDGLFGGNLPFANIARHD